eukprot:350571-Chlamydomonas_euryale.AAC.4
MSWTRIALGCKRGGCTSRGGGAERAALLLSGPALDPKVRGWPTLKQARGLVQRTTLPFPNSSTEMPNQGHWRTPDSTYLAPPPGASPTHLTPFLTPTYPTLIWHAPSARNSQRNSRQQQTTVPTPTRQQPTISSADPCCHPPQICASLQKHN